MFRHVNMMALAILIFLVVCCKKPTEPDGYRVVGYDGNTHQWTLVRTGTFDGKFLRKRLVLVCQSFTWGQHPSVTGDDACHLVVGRLIVPNPFAKDRKDSIDVFEMPDEIISITEGTGDDRVMQQFKILKYEVLPEER